MDIKNVSDKETHLNNLKELYFFSLKENGALKNSLSLNSLIKEFTN